MNSLSHHQRLIKMSDQAALLDYEPGQMSRAKQAHEMAMELQQIPVDELNVEDEEVYVKLKEKVWSILNG